MSEIDRYFDLDKKLAEAVEHEGSLVDDFMLEGLFFEDEQFKPAVEEAPKKRGRPKGVTESKPRKRSIDTSEMRSRIEEAIIRLDLI